MFGKGEAELEPVYEMAPGADLLYFNQPLDRNLRVFGVPGASLYHADIADDNGQLQAGIKGEQRVADELARIAANYPNTYVFHSVKLPGRVGDMDHIVVQGNRVLLVDSKNWKSNARYTRTDFNPETDIIYRDGEQFPGGEVHLRRQLHDWNAHFITSNLKFEAVLLIANHNSEVENGYNTEFYFTNLTMLEGVFAQVFTTEQVNPLTPEMLRYYADLVQDPNFDPSDENNYIIKGYTPAYTVPGQATRLTGIPGMAKSWWLVAWSFANYIAALLLLFPFIILSAVPLIVVAHRTIPTMKRQGLPTLKVTLVLVFQYLLLGAWFFTIFVTLGTSLGRMQ